MTSGHATEACSRPPLTRVRDRQHSVTGDRNRLAGERVLEETGEMQPGLAHDRLGEVGADDATDEGDARRGFAFAPGVGVAGAELLLSASEPEQRLGERRCHSVRWIVAFRPRSGYRW